MYPRASGRWSTPLGRWVGQFGAPRLAEELGVRRQTVYHWIAGRSRPRTPVALRIVALSSGALSLEALYREQRTHEG